MNSDMHFLMRQFAIARSAAFTIGVIIAFGALDAPGLAQAPPSPDERVAALVASLKENQTRLTQVPNGSRRRSSASKARRKRASNSAATTAPMARCRSCRLATPHRRPRLPAAAVAAADGSRSASSRTRRDEMQEYMAAAGALIQQYLPPNPAQIQTAKSAGNVAVKPIDRRARPAGVRQLPAEGRLDGHPDRCREGSAGRDRARHVSREARGHRHARRAVRSA